MGEIILTDDQQAIVAKNHKLIYWYANRKGLDIDEWYGLLAIELCYAVAKHKPEQGSIANYYKLRCDGLVSKEIRKNMTKKRDGVTATLDDEMVGETVDHSGMSMEMMIQDADSDILNLKVQGYSQKEIAMELGVSQSYVSRALKELREKLELDR